MKFNQLINTIFLFLAAGNGVVAFTSTGRTRTRMQPVHENFYLDFAEDPAINTPREIFGEVAYKSFAEKTVPDGLLSRKADIIQSLRREKVLSLAVDSGIITALEEKGLTLSKIEKLLPLIDDARLLPLLVKNKALLLSLAPAAVDLAPTALPLLIPLLKTPPSTFSAIGTALVAGGAYEYATANGLAGGLLVLLGLPAVALSAALGAISGDIPAPKAPVASSSSFSSNAEPVVAVKAAKVEEARPKIAKSPVVVATASGGQQRRRKTVRVN
jgi:hypothetical protein